jgi:hypothetical protein
VFPFRSKILLVSSGAIFGTAMTNASTPKILIQLDTDTSPSTFDGVVAVDAGVDHLFRHGGVTPQNVTPLVHGAMFTRGGKDLAGTAIFIGGSDVAAGEKLFEQVRGCFFGPVRVSVMLDPNGCNTTAAAAVVAASRHLTLAGSVVGVLAGTGPVGRRVAEMAAIEGANVVLASRTLDKAEAAAADVNRRLEALGKAAAVRGCEVSRGESCDAMLKGCDAVIACGAAGVVLADARSIESAPASLRVAIDLNAVPPLGIEGVQATDKAAAKLGRIVYGAIGVGGLKMKTHRRCIRTLFESNDQSLDAAQILAIAKVVAAE